MDLLIFKNASSHFVVGLKTALIMIDYQTRFVHCNEVVNYSLNHLQQQLLTVFVAHRLRVSVCLAGRQSAFASQHFRELLADRNCCFKLILRNRHALVAEALNSSF